MSRLLRNVISLDYKELNRTGRRVVKNRDKQPKMEEIKTEAIKIRSDVEDLFNSYELTDLIEEDD